MIVPLGDAVLDLTLRAAVRHDLVARDLTFAVNVSPVQLRSPGFADAVLDRLAEHGVPAERLVIEVTETRSCTSGTSPCRRSSAWPRRGW